jgi:hypothetical protein
MTKEEMKSNIMKEDKTRKYVILYVKIYKKVESL